MANEQNIISLGYDMDKLTAQQKVVVEYLQATIDYADKIDGRKMTINGWGDLAKAVKSTNDAQKEYGNTVAGLNKNLDELQKMEQQEIKVYEKRQALGSAAAQSLAQEKEALSQRNKEVKNSAIVNSAAEGSINQLKAALNLLTTQYDAMGEAERDSAAGTELLQKIQGQDKALKELEGSTGRYQRNVGNYTGAVKILEKQLQDVTTKIDSLTKSGNSNSSQMKSLQDEQTMLSTILNKNAQGFASVAAEVKANEKALATMAAQGLQNTEAFRQLQMATANAKVELDEFRSQQKMLSSAMPGVVAMTTAIKGLSGAYAIGAGLSAMFADGNEKVEKELNKLVAVMTILQGLNEVNELILKKGTIATIVNTAAQKLKNFVLTGNVKASQQQTAANIAQAESEEVLATATVATSAAMKVLRTALIATGIGALLILIPTVANAMSEWTSETKEAEEEQKRLADIQEEAAKNTIKERIELQALLTVAKDDTKSKKERSNAVSEINEKLKPYNEQISLEKINTEQTSKVVDDYVLHLNKKAIAQSYMSELQKLYTKQIEDESSALEDNIKWYESLWNYIKTGGNIQAASIKDIETSIKNKNKLLNDDKKTTQSVLESFKKALKDGTAELDFSKQKDESKDYFKNIQDGIQGQILALQALRIIINATVSDDKKSTQERIDALNKLKVLDMQIAEAEAVKAKAQKDISKQEIANINAELANKKTEIQINSNKQIENLVNQHNETIRKANEDANKSAIERKLAFEQQVFDSDKHSLDERLAAFEQYVKNKKDIDDQALLTQLNNAKTEEERESLLSQHRNARAVQDMQDAEKRNAIIESSYKAMIDKIQSSVELAKNDSELASIQKLAQAFKAGKISAAEYQKQLEKIKNTAESTALDTLIIEFEASYKAMDKNTDAAKQLLSTITQLKIKQEESAKQPNNTLTQIQKFLDSDVGQAVVNLNNEVLKSVQSLVDDGYQAELNALQQKKDLQDEMYSTELKNIERSNLSQQDKAAMTVQLQAQQQAADKAIERQQRDIKNRQAKADRAFAIANIIENTAIAVTKTLPNFILAALVGALGAVQLATVLAKPIPQYAEGTDNHPGGPAVVGEGKHKELVTTPQGDSFIADKPMLLDLPRGTSVSPLTSADIYDMAVQSSMRGMARFNRNIEISEKRKINESWEIARWQTEQLKKAVKTEIKNKVKVNIKNDFGFQQHINKYVYGIN